jgi:hypothetical protein
VVRLSLGRGGGEREDLPDHPRAAAGMAGHQGQMALGVRIRHVAAEDFDRKNQGRQHVVEFMDHFAGVEVEHRTGGRGGKAHGAIAASNSSGGNRPAYRIFGRRRVIFRDCQPPLNDPV